MFCPRVLDALRLSEAAKRHDKSYTTLSESQLVELLSQYPILASIATELSERDLLSLGLACKATLSCVTSRSTPQRLLQGLKHQSLRCRGLGVQLRPLVDVDPKDVCYLPCTKKAADVNRCHGCGVAVCESCRFRITHGTMLTLFGKRYWFFPSQTPSGPGLINDNLECLVSSFSNRGHGAHQAVDGKPCSCTYEDRWLDKWLCVPCLNRDLLAEPSNEETKPAQPEDVRLL